jgi:hypothetical protein
LIVRERDRLNPSGKYLAIPLDQVAFNGDTLVAPDVSPWQVRAAPAYRERGNADRELLGTETVLIPGAGGVLTPSSEAHSGVERTR